jgi:hypothetical protein
MPSANPALQRLDEPSTASPPIRVAIDPKQLSHASLHACARVFARLCVEKALQDLGLDRGPTNYDSPESNHI